MAVVGVELQTHVSGPYALTTRPLACADEIVAIEMRKLFCYNRSICIIDNGARMRQTRRPPPCAIA